MRADRIISVVSDPARNCFYTLTEKNTISIYKPTTEKSIQHVQTLSNLYKAAQDRAPGSPAITPQSFQIISIHAIDPSESHSDVQLLAVTTNGVRLYFAPAQGYYPTSNYTPGARTLQLLHVRLPPPNLLHPDDQENAYRPPTTVYGSSQTQQRTSRPYILSSIDSSCYTAGLTIAAQPGDVDGTDYLLCMAPDLTRIGSLDQVNLPQQPPPQQPYFNNYGGPGASGTPLAEYATLLAIPGRTWAMAPVPHTPSASTSAGIQKPAVTNELASQFGEGPRQFMILTNVGVTFLVKRRALDYLKAVLEEWNSEGSVQPIIEFRDR